MSGTAVVTIVRGRHDHLVAQQRSLARSDVLPDAYVVVAMGDPDVAEVLGPKPRPHVLSVDVGPAGLPLAAARNAGMDEACALGCDVLIGLDVDCLASRELVAGYTTAVRADPWRAWSGPVTYLDPPGPGGYPLDRLAELDDPHPARPAPAPGKVVHHENPGLFWSLSFALSLEAWSRTGGFDERYVGYGAEDTDFGQRLKAAGIGLGWVGTPRAYHQYHPISSPPVEHLDDILRNGRLYRERWGEWPMRGWLDELEDRGLVERSGTDYRRVR